MSKMTDDEVMRHEAITTLGAIFCNVPENLLRTRFIYDLEHDLYSRVRRHQVKEQHTHFWDDQTKCWIDLKTLQPER